VRPAHHFAKILHNVSGARMNQILASYDLAKRLADAGVNIIRPTKIMNDGDDLIVLFPLIKPTQADRTDVILKFVNTSHKITDQSQGQKQLPAHYEVIVSRLKTALGGILDSKDEDYTILKRIQRVLDHISRDYVINLLNKVKTYFSDHSLPMSICHGDLQEANVIGETIIDIENLSVRPRLVDVVWATYDRDASKPQMDNLCGRIELTDAEMAIVDDLCWLHFLLYKAKVFIHIKPSVDSLGGVIKAFETYQTISQGASNVVCKAVASYSPWCQRFTIGKVETPGVIDCQAKWKSLGLTTEMITGKNCLDIGCNTGWYTHKLATLGASRATGMDVSKPAINAAKLLFGSDCTCTFRAVKAEDENEQYDLVLCLSFTSMHKLGAEDSTLRMILDKLRPGGRLVIELPCNSSGHEYTWSPNADNFREMCMSVDGVGAFIHIGSSSTSGRKVFHVIKEN